MADSKKAANARVYEYVADDGTVYWSLTQLSQTVSPPVRLVLQDRKGLVPGQFLGRLRMEMIRTQSTGGEVAG
jgi:hypothetical protein